MTNELASQLNLKPIFESVIDNPYLEDFYDNMSRWSFNLQIYFLYDRFYRQIELMKSNVNFIQDRTIYEDKEIFAFNLYKSGKMSERDWKTYSNLFSTMSEFIKAPNLIVYLKANTDTLISRIKNRKREFEKDISPEYIHSLNIYYDRWINSLNQDKVLVVDTNNFNIFKDKDVLENIINDIKKFL
ncbi:MAG: deoxynucleoside kinase [Candidatus Marinimicrobia bacterium]|nr:deoxynucleoside kinase [Candidatus Neomarinimicrobiota bacterium]